MSAAVTTENIRIPVMLNPVARELALGYDSETLTFEFAQPNAIVMRASMVELDRTNEPPVRWSI